ncbi:MAG: HNH endonuclease [Acidimicrobiia bacterium]|nr:HNH endonuclease [Acidimicrobiia bacterium]
MFVVPTRGSLERRALEQRFWQHAEKTPGCWPWQSYLVANGYGGFWLSETKTYARAHRLAYALAYDEWPGELQVCHKCDNPPCVRPDHLFLGTHDDNHRDKVRKSRHYRGEDHRNAVLTEAQAQEARAEYAANPAATHGELAAKYGVHPRTMGALLIGRSWRYAGGPTVRTGMGHRKNIGTRNGSAKLTEQDVREIRAAYRRQEATMDELAARYGVSEASILNVVRRKTWRHI